MENYYEETLRKIKEAIFIQDYELANQLIINELQAPYVPFDFEQKLEDMRLDVVENLKQKQGPTHYWNVEKVLEVMSKKMNQDMHLVAFDALRGLNARLILEDIEQYLWDQEIDPEYKSFLIMVLIEQKIDKDILIVKNNQRMILNPAKYDFVKSQKILKSLELKIENIIYNENPSLFIICNNIASSYYNYVFPFIDLNEELINNLSIAIIQKAYKLIGLEFDQNLILNFEYNQEQVNIFLALLNKII